MTRLILAQLLQTLIRIIFDSPPKHRVNHKPKQQAQKARKRLIMKNLKKLFIYRKKLIRPYIESLLKILDLACYIMSTIFIIAVVYHHGFRISPDEEQFILTIYRFVWVTMLANSLSRICFDFKRSFKQFSIFTWIVHSLLYLSAIPVLIQMPASSPLIDFVWRLLSSDILRIAVLATLSLLQITSGVVSLLGKRANPSLILSTSFFIFILIGTAMLMLPRSTIDGINFIDALFMSTSAVCVTGLATVDIASTFTPMGLMFILILIQVGGLGVMTLTSFFAMFFIGNTSVGNQAMVSDIVSSKSLNSLLSTLLYILGFTIIIEAAGAIIIFLDIHSTMGMSRTEEIGFSIFHSISAFCNAGFSSLPGNLGNEALMQGHNVFYLAITMLILLGGIGFPILVNIYQTISYYIKTLFQRYVLRRQRQSRIVHLYDINTRIVLIMSLILIAGGTLVIAFFEWNSGFEGMGVMDKWVHSFFNAACPRTAGFSSVPISSFGMQTLLILMLLMVIGGGTQSTAGGLKVNVFAVVMLNLRAIIFGEDKVTVFNRELSHDSLRRSNSTLVLYISIVFAALFTLTILEPEIGVMALAFEAISALSTVGSSLDVTPLLGNDSKVVVIGLMFIGRVGVLTMMSSLIKTRKGASVRYPSGNIIIN